MSANTLGIRRLHSIECSVHEAGRWLVYLTQGFGFQHTAVTQGPVAEATGTRRHLLRCGDVCLILQEPVHAGSYVRRWFEAHPEGIATVNFQVDNVARTEEQLRERHATLIDFVQSAATPAGEWKRIATATPIGDVEFAFIQCPNDPDMLMPGMDKVADFVPAQNPIGLSGIDHLTANVRTLMPVVAFSEHVLGFERLWDAQFHAEDVMPGIGGGLKSVVMGSGESGFRIAVNEPQRPRFEASQIQLYVDMNRGPGIAHLAFGVRDIVAAFDHAAGRGIGFLPTPPSYYEALPARLGTQDIGQLAHPVEALQQRGILVDGGKGRHLLQIFCQDQARQFQKPTAGPVFIELVQRCGAEGFGEGNFRALFEAMMRQPAQGPGAQPPHSNVNLSTGAVG